MTDGGGGTFGNATYGFYRDALGRSAVPDEAAFNRLATENMLFVRRLLSDGLLRERERNGIASAVCMMVEVDWNAEQVESGRTAPDASESVGGYSHSVDTKAYDAHIERNAKSVDAQKYKWLSLYCDVLGGLR